jgi:hypothetical protein
MFKTVVDNSSWSLPPEAFGQVCQDKTMEPDQDGYPLAPNGDHTWRFSQTTPNISQLNGYWRWLSAKSTEKTSIKVNESRVQHIRYVFRCKGKA